MNGASNVIFEHSYQTPGLYTVRLSAFNQVSHTSTSIKVGVLQDIQGVSLVAYTSKYVTLKKCSFVKLYYARGIKGV